MQEKEMTGGKSKNNIMKTCKVINSWEKPNGENYSVFPMLE